MLAHAGPAGDAALLATLNASWLAGHLPPAWKEADIQPIPKPREPTKLRPISLISCTAKTAERMVLSRLQWRVGALHPHVFGFTRGVGTADSLLTLLTQANNCPTVTVFLDLEKAFELASPHAILATLARKGIRGRLLAWLEDYLQHRRARVKFQGLKSRYKELENGTPQGASSARFLFNLLMEELVALPFQAGTVLLSYADDLALVVTGRGDGFANAARSRPHHRQVRGAGPQDLAQKSRAMTIKAANPVLLHLRMLSRLGWGSGLRSAAQNPRSSSSPPTHLTPKEAARMSRAWSFASANEAHDDDDESVPSLVIDMSVRSEDQQEAAQGRDWTTVVNGRAARRKFKLGSLVVHASAYLAITALEDENPTLRMEAQPHVVSATRLRGRDNIATRQVLIVHEGPPPAKLTLRPWGTYTLRPYRSEPVRCYKCQRFNHLQCPERLRRMPRLQQQPQAPRWRQNRYHETRGQPQEQQRQHRFIPAPLPARPAWVKAAKQPSPLIPRDPTPGRGSDGRESEAQLPVSVEEAATITPAAILSPPLPKRETGTRSRSPPQEFALKVSRPASYLTCSA
ncbi:LINE-1 retrotransposable element ORF2 protein [Chionoecetes opilio]|uniref:LINE-1 retrotransposable element ORF2 protein n=1 Tax=Chionoecetes opilio TaxID=41210 RepID=A0A8J4Y0A1_CHIOP|nr:LINE-1 retrotransposable element ORF2 protein [Chionoecetes opilio]